MTRNSSARLIAIGALVLGQLVPALALADGSNISGEVSGRNPKARVGVVVHLDGVPGTFRPPAKPTTVDQKGMTFIPHVVALQKGGTVVFHNSDSVRHNVFTPDGDKYNLGTWGQNETKSHSFPATGIYRQLCNIHPEMSAVIVVLDNPYFAVTGPDGKFTIENVPPGSYTLKAWSEKGGEATQKVTVAAGAPTTVKVELGK
jgi:plastocyanin